MSLLAIRIISTTTELIALFEGSVPVLEAPLFPLNCTQVNYCSFTVTQHPFNEHFTNPGAGEAGHLCWDPTGPQRLQVPPELTVPCSGSSSCTGAAHQHPQTSLAAAHPDPLLHSPEPCSATLQATEPAVSNKTRLFLQPVATHKRLSITASLGIQ